MAAAALVVSFVFGALLPCPPAAAPVPQGGDASEPPVMVAACPCHCAHAPATSPPVGLKQPALLAAPLELQLEAARPAFPADRPRSLPPQRARELEPPPRLPA